MEVDGKRILRVFPRKTHATPDDAFVRINVGPGLVDYSLGIDEVHISVVFTWDLERAYELAKLWEPVAPVKVGGPATGCMSGEFTPGLYMKQGCVITSRGCKCACWFCYVPKREKGFRELSVIHDGHEVQDDNLLCCSEEHIRKVFAMLRRQKEPVKFTGGLEAARLQDWHVHELTKLNLDYIFFAYDTPNDYEPLLRAGRLLADARVMTSQNQVCKCYVLAGYPKDTAGKAEERVVKVMQAGFFPFVMIYRDDKGHVSDFWKAFRSHWRVGAISVLHEIHLHYKQHLFPTDRRKTRVRVD